MAVPTEHRTAWVLKKRAQRPTWSLPKAQTVGFIRAKCNGMEGQSFSAGVVLMPLGQGTPVHSNTGEHIIFQLEGEIEFRIEEESYLLEAGDMFFIPTNVPYSYYNVGRTTASFISIIGKVDEWPPQSTYYD